MGCMGSKQGSVYDAKYRKSLANCDDLLNTYIIDKNRLGKGSFGSVYKGTNRMDPTSKLAIKKIDKQDLTKEEVDGIHKEVLILSRADHPNIVNYFETYDDTRFIYLCMELCQGGELIEEYAENEQ